MEFLVLKLAVCNKLHDYVYGSHVQVVTDNNPMTYILSKTMLDATGQRWAAALANLASRYLTDVHLNGNAHGLPRKHIIYSDSVKTKTLCQAASVQLPYSAMISGRFQPKRPMGRVPIPTRSAPMFGYMSSQEMRMYIELTTS